MRIALAQYALAQGMAANAARVRGLMQQSRQAQADLVIFPELCLSPFFPQYAGRDASEYAIALEHEHVREFQSSCRELGLWASPNVYLQEGGRRFDASLVIDAKGAIHGTSKMVHIAQVPCFYEQDYYTPSDTGFRVYDTPWGKVGIVVCFDRHFPESVRTCVLRGAALIVIPTANTMDEPRDIFECELRAAAYQNGVFIAMCNRVGREGEMTFCGESIVVDADGKVVARAGAEETVLVADIDLSRVHEVRSRRPYLSLRAPGMYER